MYTSLHSIYNKTLTYTPPYTSNLDGLKPKWPIGSGTRCFALSDWPHIVPSLAVYHGKFARRPSLTCPRASISASQPLPYSERQSLADLDPRVPPLSWLASNHVASQGPPVPHLYKLPSTCQKHELFLIQPLIHTQLHEQATETLSFF